MQSSSLSQSSLPLRSTTPEISEVIEFWSEAGPGKWFARDDAFDELFKEKFMAAHLAAAAGVLDDWKNSPQGVLALLLLLDQFPRNAFRESARAFATDTIAVSISKEAADSGKDAHIDLLLRPFVYMPLMHSESLEDQNRSVRLFTPLDANSLKFALLHRDIIRRFGRFPHRNHVLERSSTAEEIEFLKSGGFAG